MTSRTSSKHCANQIPLPTTAPGNGKAAISGTLDNSKNPVESMTMGWRHRVLVADNVAAEVSMPSTITPRDRGSSAAQVFECPINLCQRWRGRKSTVTFGLPNYDHLCLLFIHVIREYIESQVFLILQYIPWPNPIISYIVSWECYGITGNPSDYIGASQGRTTRLDHLHIKAKFIKWISLKKKNQFQNSIRTCTKIIFIPQNA